jgi:hypothetical protein
MPSKSSSTTQHKDYLLITNVVTHQPAEAEVDLYAESWKLPYTIDDSDLTFDGKPLNMLYEENRWQAEHHVHDSRDMYSSHSSHGKEKSSVSLD